MEKLGEYASKPTALYRLILTVALVQVSSGKVAELVSFSCFHFIPFKILKSPMFRLKTIDNKIKCFYLMLCSLELEGLLVVVVVGSCTGVVEIDNGSSAILLSWVSDISKSTFPISLDNRETSANVEQVGSSNLPA